MKEDPDLKNIMDKYDDSSFVKESPAINKGLFNQEIKKPKARSQIVFAPSTNPNSKDLQQDQIFDPITERDCSFIDNISIDNSNFIGDDLDKDKEVVLCISNLEIDNSIINSKIFSQLNNNQLHKKNHSQTNSSNLSIIKADRDKDTLIQTDKLRSSLFTRRNMIYLTFFLTFVGIVIGYILYIK
jgi:hypothetical protein